MVKNITEVGLSVLWGVRSCASPFLKAHQGATDGSAAPLIPHHLKVALELRALLQRYPYWRQGHQALAELSLDCGDIATAYASAQCLLILPDYKRADLIFILGRCFLRRGNAQQALIYLDEARSLAPLRHLIVEEQAAALMLMGRRDEAARMLETIPKERLSTEGRAALSFLHNQANN